MAGSVNKVILVGNLGRDPEVRSSQSGSKIVSFPLATSDSWNDRASGERRERTEWHRVVVFNDRLADVAERFLRKGRKVYLEGILQTRKWTDPNGQERYTTEIVLDRFRSELVLLDSNRTSEEGSYGNITTAEYDNKAISQTSSQAASLSPSKANWDVSNRESDLDDEIPF